MWHVHEPPFDYYRFTKYGLEYILRKNGFSKIEIKENTGFWQTIVLKINYYSTKIAIGPLKILLIPFWFVSQVIAPYLDKINPHPSETASYTIVAIK